MDLWAFRHAPCVNSAPSTGLATTIIITTVVAIIVIVVIDKLDHVAEAPDFDFDIVVGSVNEIVKM
jgi:hypothetical protein